MDFVKDAGEKLFGRGQAQAAMTKSRPAEQRQVKAANDAAADAIQDYIKSQNLSATGLTVTFDGATSTVSAATASRRTRRLRKRSRWLAATSPA